MTLTEIENIFGFQYPQLYKKLDHDQMLDVGEYGPDWHNTIFPRLKANPTLLLHSWDFEVLSIDAVYESIKDLADPEDYRQIKPEFQFIPFAQSGGGDYYCFFLNEQLGNDIPIILIYHDCNEVIYLAKNLQDFIFRTLLTDMSDQDTYNGVSDEEFKSNFKNIMSTHSKYLTEKQSGILQNIISKEIIDYHIELPIGRKEKHRGLLTDAELKEILISTIPYDKMDKAFAYSDEQ